MGPCSLVIRGDCDLQKWKLVRKERYWKGNSPWLLLLSTSDSCVSRPQGKGSHSLSCSCHGVHPPARSLNSWFAVDELRCFTLPGAFLVDPQPPYWTREPHHIRAFHCCHPSPALLLRSLMSHQASEPDCLKGITFRRNRKTFGFSWNLLYKKLMCFAEYLQEMVLAIN